MGTFDINLPLIGTPGVECRDGGGSYSFVFSFATNVVSGNASVTLRDGNRRDANLLRHDMAVPLTSVIDVQTLTVILTGVTDASSQVLPPTSV